VIEERDEEEEVIEVGEVTERGVGQIWEMQRRIDALQEIMETYERSSKRTLRMLSRVDEREETLRKIRTMVNRCGNIHLLRQPVIEHIYDTAWTINGEQVMGRTSGWRWYELGTEDTLHQAYFQSVVVTQAYAERQNTPLQWGSIIYTYDQKYGTETVRAPQRNPTCTSMEKGSYVPPLPEHKKGEMAILSVYSDESGNYPSWRYHDSSSAIKAFSMFAKNSIQGQNYTARLQLPMAAALRVTIDGPGDGNTLGMPKGMRWRAIVGEYTAPGT
jgi:hypothetical protein